MTEAEQIAAFLAQRGATQCDAGAAYGVDKEADKAKRLAERDRRASEEAERQYEQRMEAAHDAFFVGDHEEGYAQMTGVERLRDGSYRRVRFERY